MKGCYELWNKSYILPKEFEIFTVMNAEQSWQYRINFIRCCIFTDIRIFRLRLFEYFDVFRKEIGTISSRELYKFFDREGDTLALRPDITPSIARAAATLFETEDFPIRLCYVGSTFINHSSYQGRLKESTQLGAELIGIDSVEADAEMIAMVVDGLKK